MGQNFGLFKCFLQSFFRKKPKLPKYLVGKKERRVDMVIKDYFEIKLKKMINKNIDFY